MLDFIIAILILWLSNFLMIFPMVNIIGSIKTRSHPLTVVLWLPIVIFVSVAVYLYLPKYFWFYFVGTIGRLISTLFIKHFE